MSTIPGNAIKMAGVDYCFDTALATDGDASIPEDDSDDLYVDLTVVSGIANKGSASS